MTVAARNDGEVTNPHHLALLVNGTRLVVDHCVFHKVKQTAVFQTPGSTGHAIRNCLIYDAYAAAVWTSSIATDFDYRNNIVTNSNYVWIGQSARTALAENGRGRAGGPPAPATAASRGTDMNDVGRYQVRDSLFVRFGNVPAFSRFSCDGDRAASDASRVVCMKESRKSARI